MTRSRLTLLLSAAALALSLGIAGCGGGTASPDNATPAEPSETAQEEDPSATAEESAPDIDLSKYLSLKSGECVLISADGSETVYENQLISGTAIKSHGIGLEQLFIFLNDTRTSNEFTYEDMIDGAVVVCRGDVLTVQRKDDYAIVFISFAYEFTQGGHTGTPDPLCVIEMSVDQVKDLGIDVGSEILVAGRIGYDRAKVYMYTGPGYEAGHNFDYDDGLVIIKSPALVEVVEEVQYY